MVNKRFASGASKQLLKDFPDQEPDFEGVNMDEAMASIPDAKNLYDENLPTEQVNKKWSKARKKSEWTRAELRYQLSKTFSPRATARLLKVAYGMGMKGDLAAMRLYLDYVVGKPEDPPAQTNIAVIAPQNWRQWSDNDEQAAMRLLGQPMIENKQADV